jgi:hypothetical protein
MPGQNIPRPRDGAHQLLDLVRRNGVTQRIFERYHVKPGHVATHQRQQAEDFALAPHVEHEFFAHVGADA